MNNPLRRRIVLGLAVLPAAGLARAAMTTPGATEGPFYPSTEMRHADADNDLVKIQGLVERAGGEIVRLRGRVLDRRGNPVEAARVEIWQCDVNGRYLHRGDVGSGERDPAFQGFGIDRTGADGVYRFRTIRPVPYSGRAPHIHVKVRVDGLDRLTTQFYLPDHPGNAHDWLYRRISEQQRGLVTMRFSAAGNEPEAEVDLVI